MTKDWAARVAAAIRQIGRPGFGAALWDLLACVSAADNLVVMAYGDAGPPQVLFRQGGHARVFARLESGYLGGAWVLDPYFALHRSRAAAGLYRLRDVAPDAFARTRYYREYYQATTLVDELTCLCWPHPDLSVALSLGRDASSGRMFSAREAADCAGLAPVVAALSERHWADLFSAAPVEAGDPAADLIAAAAGRGLALTRRQAEVALLILQGHSTVSIGLRLGVSAQTVKVFRKQLYARCAIASQAELFALMLPMLRGAD